MTPEGVALLAGAGLLAGAVNAVAGGGSLISFPALLAAGYPGVTAAVTNTVALSPGYAGGVVGGRRELVGQAPQVRRLLVSAALGAAAGSALLLVSSDEAFEDVVPFLVLLACALLAVQQPLSRRVAARPGARSGWWLQGAVLLAAGYGAYFGAGLGIMLLAVLGVAVAERFAVVNALKKVLSLVINVVALVAYAFLGPVAWAAAGVVAVTSLVGGYLAGRLAPRLPGGPLRAAVVVYGVVVAVVLLVRG